MDRIKNIKIFFFTMVALSCAAYFSYKNILCLDMYSGNVNHEQYLFGMKISEEAATNEISAVAERLNLLGKRQKKICLTFDRDLIFYSNYYYSQKKSLYHDLLGLSKVINSGSADEETAREATHSFQINWNKLEQEK